MADKPVLNVFQVTASCIRDIKSVAKTNLNKQFACQSITDVVGAVHTVCGQHGLIIVPSVLRCQQEVVTSNSGTPGWHTVLEVQFTVYGPTGDSIVSTAFGESISYSDKNIQIAMSSAQKYFLIRYFLIPISDDETDGDRETPSVKSSATKASPAIVTPAQLEQIATLKPTLKTIKLKGISVPLEQLTVSQADQLIQQLNKSQEASN